MKTTNKTKKETKPILCVNLTEAESPLEVKAAFVLGKVNANIAITPTELAQFAEYVVDITMQLNNLIRNKCAIIIAKEKTNIFAKVWRRIKNIFKKSK